MKQVNDVGGEFPAWSKDGRKLMWSLGNALWTYDLDRAKVVEDSLKTEAKAKAAARRDSLAAAGRDTTGVAAPAAPRAVAGDTSKKDKPGYKPAETRILGDLAAAERRTPDP